MMKKRFVVVRKLEKIYYWKTIKLIPIMINLITDNREVKNNKLNKEMFNKISPIRFYWIL